MMKMLFCRQKDDNGGSRPKTPRRERRRRNRQRAREGAFAVLNDEHEKQVVSLLDVGDGGLACRYLENGGKVPDSKTVSLFLRNGVFRLDNLPCETVRDERQPCENSFCKIQMRRRGLRFGRLTEEQERKLQNLIAVLKNMEK